jgi:hypothetical protein
VWVLKCFGKKLSEKIEVSDFFEIKQNYFQILEHSQCMLLPGVFVHIPLCVSDLVSIAYGVIYESVDLLFFL